MPQFDFSETVTTGWNILRTAAAQHGNFAQARPFGQAQR